MHGWRFRVSIHRLVIVAFPTAHGTSTPNEWFLRRALAKSLGLARNRHQSLTSDKLTRQRASNRSRPDSTGFFLPQLSEAVPKV
jgi:hypothetical protein